MLIFPDYQTVKEMSIAQIKAEIAAQRTFSSLGITRALRAQNEYASINYRTVNAITTKFMAKQSSYRGIMTEDGGLIYMPIWKSKPKSILQMLKRLVR